ncbi:MAG TPA: hypothetical protein VF824_06475 [Thermoanaerobaculia bacterium]
MAGTKGLQPSVRELAVGNDGEFRYVADVRGGDAPYTYEWQGTVGSRDFTARERMTPIFQNYADRYAELTVTDRNNCKAAVTIGHLVPKKCTLTQYATTGTTGALQALGLEIHWFGSGVSWRVELENRGLKGFSLGQVEIKRPGDVNYNTVLHGAGATEIFVPYHDGAATNRRLWDMQNCGPFLGNPHPCMREIKPADVAPVDATLLTLPGDSVPMLAAECRDQGLAAFCKYLDPSGNTLGYSRRAKEVVIWAVYDTGNYDYVIQYGFRNDGRITFRLGASGYNSPANPNIASTAGNPFTPHMHNVLWRVNTDLFGAKGDRAFQSSHFEPQPGLTATDSDSVFFGEGMLAWDPLLFQTLTVEGGGVNRFGNPIAYEFVPADRTGTSHHWGNNEQFTTRWDWWVTRNHPGEDGTGNSPPNNWGTVFTEPDNYLLKYVMNDATLTNGGPEALNHLADLVVWYRSSAHHGPIDEDRQASDTINTMTGLTLMHWQGFDMEPHNLFDYNPVLSFNGCYPN